MPAPVRAVRDVRRSEDAQLRPRFAGRGPFRRHERVGGPARMPRASRRRSAAAEVDGAAHLSDPVVGWMRHRLRMAGADGRVLAAQARSDRTREGHRVRAFMTLTATRKRRFCQRRLSKSTSPLGFADVGSGGPLKQPWKYLEGAG